MKLLMLLQRHRRAKAAWLAQQLEVSTRTVLRDMEALSSAGVPVFTEQGPGGGCVLMDGFTTDMSGLTPGEAQALFAWATREGASDLGLGPDLVGALAKISAAAPPEAVKGAEVMAGAESADRRSSAGAHRVEHLSAIRKALGSRVRLSYVSPEEGREQVRVVDPMGLVDNGGRWYLVAEERGQPRTFRVSRVKSFQAMNEESRPRDRRPVLEVWRELHHDPESRVTGGLDIMVRADPAEAARLRRLLRLQLAPGAQFAEEIDDQGRLVWRLTVRQPEVIAAMAVLASPSLTVVEPAWLRREVVEGARRALSHYAKNS